LLANIALSAIDERYARHAWPRRRPTPLTDGKEIAKRALKFRRDDREGGCLVLFPIRYADDFIIFVSAPAGPTQDVDARLAALDEKEKLATFLRNELRLELSATKTLVTPVTGRMRFLGHHVCVRPHPKTGRMVSTAVVPRDASQRLRERIKALFRRHTTWSSLAERLQILNPMLRGWANFYRHAWGAKRVFNRIDHYVWWTIFRWVRKRHRRVARRIVCARYAARHGWCSEGVARFKMAKLCVEQYKLGWMRLPRFAESPMESPMHNERCTSGSVRGAQKPAGASRTRR
jgi:hypothetical protein